MLPVVRGIDCRTTDSVRAVAICPMASGRTESAQYISPATQGTATLCHGLYSGNLSG